MPTRLLVLAVDAANPDLLRRWAADGTLPAIQGLIERGASIPTCGLEGLFAGSTWPSLSSGVAPGRHGIHYLAQVPPGRDAYEAITGWPERVDPFWVSLSRAGRRVAVLDVPLSRIAPGLNGIQTVEWGAHDTLYGFHASPPALETEIETAFGSHPQTGSCDARRATTDDYQDFLNRLAAGASAKGELTRALLGREHWDLVVQVFSEAHCAGHQCWHLHDPTHPSHSETLAAALGDPLERTYRAVDAAIGRVLAEAAGATVILLASHGMAHSYGTQFLLPELLFRLGVAAPTREEARRRTRWWRGARRGWRTLPEGARASLGSIVRRGDTTSQPGQGLPTVPVDVSRSLCFPVANGPAVGAIRLNVVGREPAGRLEPADVEAFSDRLAVDLSAVVDLDTGLPLVRRVVQTNELYSGPCLELLPDLLVEWSDNGPTANTHTGPRDAAIVRAASKKTGTVRGVNAWGRTGEHRPGGLVVAAGEGIRPGKLPEASILDIAPTITRLLGVRVPDVDGAPIIGLGPPLAADG